MNLLLSRLLRGVSVALVVLSLGCSDPYKQTVEAPDSREYASFVSAMKKLPLEEKNLVNAYMARMEADGVRPAGVTLREAIDQQRQYEAEVASLPNKLIDGAVRIAQALGPKRPLPPVATAAPPPVTAPPVATAPAPVQPPAATAAPTLPATAAPVVPPAPATTAAPGAPAPITGLELSSLFQEIDAQTFPQEKVDLIKDRGKTRYFTTRQAIALARTVAFPDMQVEILSSLYPRIVDRESFDDAYRIFAFPRHRDALKDRVDAINGR